MDFLRSFPSVCAVGDKYQIVGSVQEFGTVAVEVNGQLYYEDNSGVLPCMKRNYKISVPRRELDIVKQYAIVYKRVIEKKKYFSVVEEEVKKVFNFKPIEKTEDINIIHLADVHKRYALAKSASEYFGDECDLFIINGDIDEVEKEEDFLEVLSFIGEVARGETPIVFVRGNHDTRGKLAEKYAEYFPSNGKSTFFNFEVGCVGGIALDVGEDKVDKTETYAGLNVFENYRKIQTEYLKSQQKTKKKYFIAVSHIPICKTTLHKGDEFDIESDTYTTWCEELKRIGTNFLISGHLHKAFVIDKDDESKTCPCDIPLIVGSALFRPEEIFWGCAINLSGNQAHVKFVCDKKEVKESYIIDLTDGKVKKE